MQILATPLLAAFQWRIWDLKNGNDPKGSRTHDPLIARSAF